jgi:predicted permease
VAVIGHGFWQRQFGGVRDVLGKTIGQGRVAYTIVGVAPRGFSGSTPERVDVWLPAQHAARASFGAEWEVNSFVWQVVACARPGRTAAQAAAEGLIRLRAVRPDPRYSAGGEYKRVQAGSIVPGRAPTGPTTGLRLSYIVGGAAALVALIALANAAGLLLLRALRRRRETAVRLVLGVSRGRLLRAVAVESMLLALLAGAAACFVAAVGGELLRKLLLRVDWAVPVVDPRVALLTLGVSLAIGFLAGLVPGWLAGRPETVEALKAGIRDTGGRRAPARAALLVVQAGLSVALLAGLALYLRSFQRARAFDFGPDVDQLLVAELQEETQGRPGPMARDVSEAVASRVGALPGVQTVALSSSTPLWGAMMTVVRAEGVDSFPRGTHGPYLVEAGPTYFAATGLALVRGRYFADQGPGGPRESVVSREMASLWRNGDAIGHCLYIGPGAADCTRIVGVVRDLRMSLRDPAPGLIYYIPLAYGVMGIGARSLIVRAAAPARLVPAVRQIVAAMAGVRSPDAVRTLRDVVDPQYRRLRQGMALFGIFAGLAVVVAMIGIYSVVAYSVTQRTHEFGIRVALGARAPNLVRLVLGQALRYAGTGLMLGLVLALASGRYVAPLLYQTSARDPLALGAAAFALLLAAALACVVPARAAARADPRKALQAE